MNNKIILTATFIVLGVLFMGQAVRAADVNLFVSPATASKNVGSTFNVSVQIDPQGNKVCVVKGILSFDGLTCRSITVASGLMVQTTPTCTSPNFTLGIPKCATVAQNILTVSVKGNAVGQAKASITGVKVIGVGVIVASAVSNGAYDIVTAPVQAPTPAATPTETPQPAQPEPQQQATAPVQQQAAPENNIPSGVGAASLASVASAYFWPLLILLIILCVGACIYYLLKKKKK